MSDIKEFTPAELLKELNEMKTSLEAKAKDEAVKAVDEKLKAVTDAIDALKAAKAEDTTSDQLKAMKVDLETTIKAFDILQTRVKSAPIQAPGQTKSFTQELGEKLTAREYDLKKFRVEKKGFGSIEMETKAVGNMASATSLTGSYFVTPQVLPGVITKLYESVHMRNLLPVGSTNSNVIRYVRDNGGEGGPAMVAEGAVKPQIDRDLEILDANVRKMATYFRVPEEMIDDIPYLQSFLVEVGLEEVMKVEDAQILYGDGTGQNLSGLFTNATAFAAGTSVITAPNNFDVLMAAKKQAKGLFTNPTVAMVNPINFFDMITKKDTTNNYLLLGGGNGLEANGVLQTKAGLTIVENTNVVAGDFLVMDPRSAAIFDRAGTTVRFYDQDQDNAIKNLITIVIEKRLALPIYRTAGLIKGTFSTAITDLTS
jgi:HK97 family phage major capsid protein